MTEREQAHLTEFICLARGRGASDAEIATLFRTEAEKLAPLAQEPKDDTHG